MANKKRVLLMTSRSTTNSIQDSLAIPYGLHILKNYLSNHEIDCDVFDFDISPGSECFEKIKKNNYDIIGISVTHWNMVSDLNLVYAIRKMLAESKKKALFIAGGFSATLNYKEWLDNGFDVVCVGYAEETLKKICENYSAEKTSEELKSFFNTLNGVAFIDSAGKGVFRPSKPLLKEEFENKMFASAMKMEIPYKEYWDFMRKRATEILSINNRSYVVENARLYTSSKCLANCGYCCCPAFLNSAQNCFANLYMLSAEQIKELVIFHIKKYGAKSFSLNDEDFIIGNKLGINRVMRFCDLILEAKKKGEIPEEIKFSCQTRATDFIIEENSKRAVNTALIKKMAEAKFHNVSLGIETFSDRMMKSPSINKPGSSVKEYHDVLEEMMKYHLYPTINLIFGIPEETPEELISTIEQTLRYIDKPCQVSVTTKLLSFPGAPIWNSKDYPTKKQIWENPETKQKLAIPVYYLPKNKKIADLIENLESKKLAKLDNLRKKYNFDKSYFIPRIATALCSFMTATEMLGYRELNEKISSKLDELITNTLKINQC